MSIFKKDCNSEHNENEVLDKEFKKTAVQNENTKIISLFIKPCSVALKRLNLWDHNKEILLNNNMDDFQEHQPSMVTSQLISENKDKTLRCATKVVDLNDSRSNVTDFIETKNCLHRSVCETSDIFHNSKEKELLNNKLCRSIYSTNNFKKSDSVMYIQQNQGTKTHKDFHNPYLNSFTNVDLEFSHTSRCEKFCVDCLNKKNTEIREENNRSVEENYSKNLNKAQVNKDKNKNILNQNSVNEINRSMENKASSSLNWSLEDERNKNISFYSDANTSSNCMENTGGSSKQSFNSFMSSKHLDNVSKYTNRNNRKVKSISDWKNITISENTSKKLFTKFREEKNPKLSQIISCNNKTDVPMKNINSEECNSIENVKNIKPCVVLSRLKLPAVGCTSTVNSSHLIQNEENNSKTFDVYKAIKSGEIEPSSNFINCSFSLERKKNTLVNEIAEELSKTIDDYFFERKKNREQIRKHECIPYCTGIPRSSQSRQPKEIMKILKIHCKKCCNLQKKRGKFKTSADLFGEQSALLNSEEPLFKHEDIPIINLTSEKKGTGFKVSGNYPILKPCSILNYKLSLDELNGTGGLRFSGNNSKTEVLKRKSRKICVNEKISGLINKQNCSDIPERLNLSNVTETNKRLSYNQNSELAMNVREKHEIKNKKVDETKKCIDLNSKLSVKLSSKPFKENEHAHNLTNILPKHCFNNFKNCSFLKCCHVVLRRLNLDECNYKHNLSNTQLDFREDFINPKESKPEDYVNDTETKVKLSKIIYLSVPNETNKESYLTLKEKTNYNANHNKLCLNVSKNAVNFASDIHDSLNAYNKHTDLKNIKKCVKANIKLKPKLLKKHKLVAQSIKILNTLQHCKDSKSLPCGSRKMDISDISSKFQKSVTDVKKKTVLHSHCNKMKRKYISKGSRKVKNKKKSDIKKEIIPFSYICMQCNSEFSSNSELYYHTCAGKRTDGYVCYICEQIYKTVIALKLHVKSHFDGVRRKR